MKDRMDSIEPLKAYYDYRGDALSGTAPILEYTQWLEQRYIDHHRFELQWQSNYSGLNKRFAEIKAERNIAQLRVEELTENFNKQNVEVQDLRSNLSYEKQTNKIIGAKLETLEKAEAVWIREASLLREALNKATDAVIESEAKAERYYRKVRELEIALRLNCKMEPPDTKEIKEEFSQQPTTLLQEFEKAVEEKHADIIDEIGPDPSTITWKQVMRLHGRAVELREIVRGFENERIRLQSLLRSAIEQADATYAPYRKMVSDARAEVDKTAQKLFETRAALRGLVEACHRADNDGELSGEIDGSLMNEAWRVLK